MQIQILGLRPKPDKSGVYETFYEKGWRAPSVYDLFAHIEEYIKLIPQDERFNLHYTLAQCHEKKPNEVGRKLFKQEVIGFDIDDINTDKAEEYIQAICSVLEVSHDSIGAVMTGNGIQIIVGTDQEILDENYFAIHRDEWRQVNDKINEVLSEKELPGEADIAIWDKARMFRLPMTENRKTPEWGFPNKNKITNAILLRRNIKVYKDFSIPKLALKLGGVGVHKVDVIANPPDTEYVLKECLFLRHCIEHPIEVKEPEWYAMLSVVSRLKDGQKLCHEFSKGHPDYSYNHCQSKIEQAIRSSGPRTCNNINEMFNCALCNHVGKYKGPILLKSESYVETEFTGFRKIYKENGIYNRSTKIEYDDLLKVYSREPYKCTENEIVYKWKGSHWEIEEDIFIKNFVEKKVLPTPTNHHCNEFLNKILRNNVCATSWFDETTFKKINLKNGVLDLSTSEPRFTKHDTGIGFRNVLPYDYDPTAKCPKFDEFMKKITCDRKDLEDILIEFAGYSFSNMEYEHDKILILYGDGANGKSTFVRILQNLAGKTAYASVNVAQFNNPQSTVLLEGKLFNISEETPKKAFKDNDQLKNACSGGDLAAKYMYKNQYFFANRAKIIMICNTLPPTNDPTNAFMRRLMIIPFDWKVSKEEKIGRYERILMSEASGILNRIIEGYQRLITQAAFTYSKTSTEYNKEYKFDNSPTAQFIEDYLEITTTYDERNYKEYATAKSIYNLYSTKFCDESGIKYPEPRSVLFGDFKKYIPDFKERLKRAANERYYLGIKILDDSNF